MTIDLLRHPSEVAPELLGWTIACRGTAAVLIELEAYHQEEPAAHSYGGRPTPRTEGLFGEPGSLYVYFTYGMHWCANVVTGPVGSGEALLLRAAVPIAGEPLMRERRAAPRSADPARFRPHEVLGGPGRLVQGLDIRPGDGGAQLLHPALDALETALSVSEDGPVLVRDPAAAALAGVMLPLAADDLIVGPRIGISKAVELPWRFGVRGTRASKPFPGQRPPRR